MKGVVQRKLRENRTHFPETIACYLFPIGIIICIDEFVRITDYDNTISYTKINCQENVKQKSNNETIQTHNRRLVYGMKVNCIEHDSL